MRLDVSVIVPVLDEPHLPQTLASLLGHLDQAGLASEVIVVDDGVERAVVAEGVRSISGPRRGKGAAVRHGILAAGGDVVVLVDADLAALFPRIAEFAALIARDGFDVAIAERVKDFHSRRPVRFFLSYGLYLAQRLFVFHSSRFTDTQCGLKAFSRGAALAIAARQQVEGGMYDIEYLSIALIRKMKIAQVPVGAVAETRESRIRLWTCLRRDPAELIRIKLRHLFGRYR